MRPIVIEANTPVNAFLQSDDAIYGAGLDAFTSIGSLGTYAPKESLFWEGDLAEFQYRVVRGTVCLYKLLPDGRRQVARFCHVGDLIGLSARTNYQYTADALTDVTVQRIRRAELDAHMEDDPTLRRGVLASISEELNAAQNQLLLLGRKSASERVASFLVTMTEQAMRQGGDGHSVFLPMTRVDIADYLGLTHETVCRVFSQLKAQGIVRFSDPHDVEISDATALAVLGDGDMDTRLCA